MLKRQLSHHTSKLAIAAVLASPKPEPQTFSAILEARQQGKAAKRRKLKIRGST